MSNFERKFLPRSELRKRFKDSLIDTIIELTVSRVLENTKGREFDDRDISLVLTPIMDEYNSSNPIKEQLKIDDYKAWERFSDEVVDILRRKIRTAKSNSNEISDNTPKVSQNLDQKKLKYEQKTLFPISSIKPVRKRKPS